MLRTSVRGFSLIESAVMVVLVSMLGLVIVPVVGQVRHEMRGAVSAANLQAIGQSGAFYGFENRGRVFGYSWHAGGIYTMPDGRRKHPNSDQEAAAFQNQEILMRLTGRLDGDSMISNFSSRLPNRRFSHLVLIDSMGESLQDSKYIDPEDRRLFHWVNNPLEYLEEENTFPYGNGEVSVKGYDIESNWMTDPVVERWAFASSYQMVPAGWQPDFPNPQYVPTEGSPHLYRVMGQTTGQSLNLHSGRKFFEADFFAQKVWMHEEFDRGSVQQTWGSDSYQRGRGSGDQFNQGPIRAPYFAYDQARTEKLMFDLSVNSWASGDANSSSVEHIDGGKSVWRQTYVPLHRFPLPLGGLGDQTLLDMRFRWTYLGLKGVDYGHADLRARSLSSGSFDRKRRSGKGRVSQWGLGLDQGNDMNSLK